MSVVTPEEVFIACDYFAAGALIAPVGEANLRAARELGSIGINLIEVFNRLQTISAACPGSALAVRDLGNKIDVLESLPSLSASTRNTIRGCRVAYDHLINVHPN